MQEINIDGSRCLKNRCDNVDCNSCVESCPTSAIAINGRIDINSDDCFDCGICMSTCKTGVFSFADADKRDYLTKRYPELVQKGSGLPFIICKKKAGDFSFLPDCIGMFSESDLTAAALELKQDIFVYGGTCAKCSGSNNRIIENNFSSANKILSLLNVPWRIRKVQDWENLDLQNILKNIQKKEEEKTSLSRRNFFNHLKARSMNVGATAVLNDNTEDALITKPGRKKWIPEKRKKLLDLLGKLGVSSAEQTEAGSIPFYKLTINDSCTLCNICSDFCPTGALSKYEDGFETGLGFDLLKCVRCTDCEKLCPEGAIKREQYISAEDIKNCSGVRMARRELFECIDCEMKFLPKNNERKCSRCLKLKKLDEIIFSH